MISPACHILAYRILAYLNGSDREVRSSVQVAVIREMCMEDIYGPIDSVFGENID